MATNPAESSLPRTVEALGETVLIDHRFSVAVESKSNPGHFYRLNVHAGRATECTCSGFTYRHHCRHLAAATEALRIANVAPIEYDCGCWKPRPFERGSDLWGYCKRCGGSI